MDLSLLGDLGTRIDMAALRGYRLGRVQQELRHRDCAAAVLFDPLNIRYATGSRNMAVWTAHNHVRYALVPAEGRCILFEFFAGRLPVPAERLETIAEVRPPCSWTYFYRGDRKAAHARLWAAEIADLIGALGGGNRRVAFDHLDPLGVDEIRRLGLVICDGEALMERARLIKGAEEIACMTASIAACEAAMARMRAALEPGISEIALWSILNQTNVELGGEWIETRLLSSGGRTNPWMQEASARRIRAGELVAFDSDMIGPLGYCADISRTYFCGPGRPSDEQRRLYALAAAQIEHNCALLRPGVAFREVVEREWPMPDDVLPYRYGIAHGVGLADEFPFLPNRPDFETLANADELLAEGMVLCVESYIGVPGGAEGVKLEQQVLVTADGPRILSTYPFEEDLLG